MEIEIIDIGNGAFAYRVGGCYQEHDPDQPGFVPMTEARARAAAALVAARMEAQAQEQATPAQEVPPQPPPQANPRIIRDWEFRNRFSQAQLVGIMRAAMAGDDIAALVWLQLSTASDGVYLDDPATVAGVRYIAGTYPAMGLDPAAVLAGT